MSDLQIDPTVDLVPSEKKSQRRIERAVQAFGVTAIRNLLAFAWFLMGANRKTTAAYFCMPHGTLLSLLTKIGRDGLPALEDRRYRKIELHSPAETTQRQNTPVELKTEGDQLVVTLGNKGYTIRIPAKNKLQTKVILLTLLGNDLLKSSDVAAVFQCTTTHCSRLSRLLTADDVQAVVDKRTGQQEDYRVGLKEKSEIVQQFTARIISGRNASSEVLAKAVAEQTGTVLSSRTIRVHMQKMGLNTIRKTLPKLLDTFKKK